MTDVTHPGQSWDLNPSLTLKLVLAPQPDLVTYGHKGGGGGRGQRRVVWVLLGPRWEREVVEVLVHPFHVLATVTVPSTGP